MISRRQSIQYPEALDETVTESGPFSRNTIVFSSIFAVIAIGLAIFGATQLLRDRPPADNSADAGFARDMATHHAQAVNMALIVIQRTDDELIRTMASDVLLTQQSQIGMMMGFLTAWDLPSSGEYPPMTWMGEDMNELMPGSKEGESSADVMAGMMPGLATDDEVASLKTLPVAEMNTQFLTLMIRHHQGGILMAGSALKRADTDEVRNLARGIVNSQKAEIEQMQKMLAERQPS